EFQQRYTAELSLNAQAKQLEEIRQLAQQEKVTFITATKSADYNHALVLKQLLEQE
ncbi:MAG: DUF488 family protein, partial [Acinetobacter sp.]